MVVGIARIFCSMILHVQTEKLVRQGLNRMKFAINHPEEFSTPVIAAMIGFLSANVEILLTIAVTCNICNGTNFLQVLLNFAAYSSTCMVPIFAAGQITPGSFMAAKMPEIEITQHRRYIESRRCMFWFLRSLHKTWRCMFCSIYYYFLPILTIVYPWVIIITTQKCPTYYLDVLG